MKLLVLLASLIFAEISFANMQHVKLENFDNPDKLIDRYIITMKNKSVDNKDMDVLAAKMGANSGMELGFKIHKYGLSMMSWRMAGIQMLSSVLADNTVQTVEAEVVYRTNCTTQQQAPYHLSRTSSRERGASSYSYKGTGSGVTVYVVDTGIRLSHDEFEDRAEFGHSVNSQCQQADLNGHGTHVAGIAAGRLSGVAKQAKLVTIRIFDDRGGASTSTVIVGLEQILELHLIEARRLNPTITDIDQHRVANEPSGYKRPKSVINMSIGGAGQSTAINDVLKELEEFGLFSVAAAGNSASDACNYSPAFSPHAITVGCTTDDDELCSFSNYGPCVDVLAPGLGVLSAGTDHDSAVVRKSGTSMSSPLVAGILASYLSLFRNPPSPQELRRLVHKYATRDKITIPYPDTVNLLGYTACDIPLSGDGNNGRNNTVSSSTKLASHFDLVFATCILLFTGLFM